MVTGSILRHFSTIELGTADGKMYMRPNHIEMETGKAYAASPAPAAQPSERSSIVAKAGKLVHALKFERDDE